jgi:signal peptidase
MKKFLLKLWSIISVAVAVVAFLIAGIALLATTTFKGQVKALVVRSGSMQPTIPVGSLVVVRKNTSQYQIGDVVTFQLGNVYVTHRIKSIQENQFQTQGDANNAPDTQLVSQTSVIGKVWISIPYIGKTLTFVKTPKGFSLLIILPAFIIVIQEVFAIGRELEKMKLSKKIVQKKVLDMRVVPSQAKIKKMEAKETKASRSRLSQALTMVIIVGLSTVSGTKAYFSDIAQSTNNTFSAAASFSHIVINELYYDVCTPASTCGTDPQNEWVELYNPTSSAIVLTDWKLEDDNGTDTLPSGTTIAAGSFLVITSEVGTFTFWPAVPAGQRVILGSSIGGNALGGQGDKLLLRNPANTIIDGVSYGTDTSVLNPSVPDVARGHSIERDPDGKDTDSATDFVDRTTPQPGV